MAASRYTVTFRKDIEPDVPWVAYALDSGRIGPLKQDGDKPSQPLWRTSRNENAIFFYQPAFTQSETLFWLAVDTNAPKGVIVHLVSLEAIEDTVLDSIKDKVALVSVYSLTYTSLPPDAWDVRQALQDLGSTRSVLRTFNAPDKKSMASDSLEDIMISKRQHDGYSLIRYRTITGEETAAMYRGPLTPKTVDEIFPTDPGVQSNFGTDLQILDPQLSLMDLSYAVAWQLGRTLAICNQVFTTALFRLRQTIHSKALDDAKKDIRKKLNTYTSHEDLLASIESTITGLGRVNSDLHTSLATCVSVNRWKRETVPIVNLSLRSPHIISRIYEKVVKAASTAAETPGGGKYNYHEVPKNTDYAIIQEWVLDKLHLHGVPAHYLIPDPSYLPAESIRFFYIDKNWTKALMDGALSLANH
ncbi:hypothetical protein L207DRAFT_608789 [Hyaloscypha variabilis F]|uniref:Uncharacterized protein n=1 Tax=Hyaloscypha variabilis (strain UAMH 11265 / GT02V1 / F) TaxID=1149755 RepID=A0A2J6R394_HYAVF|nr:hypothetical protein L207DRAFT_608789 [Hyaloscypha variabilis F]